MYFATLTVHSWLRWAVLAIGLLAVAGSVVARRAGRPWTPVDEQISRWFVILLDVQMLVGLVLYVAASPITRAALSNFSGAMGDSVMRYWAIEHLFGMLVGVALAHVGRARTRRAHADSQRHRTTALFTGLALFAILISIPWPGLPAGRPLLRW